MGDVVLYHSAYGLRPAIQADADRWRAAGHAVTTPDLYEGLVFDDLDAGMAEKDRLGVPQLRRRAELAVRALPPAHGRVFMGWSMGAQFALELARSQPGTAGVITMGCEIWYEDEGPDPFPAQIHAARDDEFIEEDLVAEAARRGAEVYRYAGGHVFADPGLAGYDAGSAKLLNQRVLEFLSRS